MNRIELIDTIAADTNMTKVDVGRVLDATLENIQKAVQSQQTVQLVGFGSFKSVSRAARTGRNPRTGEAVKIAASVVPRFTPGTKFKECVNTKPKKQKSPSK